METKGNLGNEPAFDNYVDAKHYAWNVIDVVELEVPEIDNQTK